MSRTDVHRPVWVMYHDPTIRHWFVDHHDHRTEACDLHEFLADPNGPSTRCYRQPWTKAPRLCGCRGCTDRDGRKLNRRVERARWRAIARELLTAHPDDREDVDVSVPHTPFWHYPAAMRWRGIVGAEGPTLET